MQHTLLITYHLAEEVMTSALLLLFIPPMMGWSNSFQSRAIWKGRAVCIQVTSAGTQSWLQGCAQGLVSPEEGQTLLKQWHTWPYRSQCTCLPHCPEKPGGGVQVLGCFEGTESCATTPPPKKNTNQKISKEEKKQKSSKGKTWLHACNQELNGFHSFMHISHPVSLHVQVPEHCLLVSW